ncbi:MAG: tRNA-dihydrouridine synthase [Candidatus Aenigmatarchaeota archaeon]
MDFACLELRNPTTNAPGVNSSTPDLLKSWEDAGIGAVVTKPIGMVARTGNPNPTLINPYPGVYINCMGLPGPGYKYFLNELSEYNFEVPVIIQIHGKDEKEFNHLISYAHDYGDGFEVNVSCPHAKLGGFHIGFDSYVLRRVLKESRKATDKPIGVKLPYYSSDDRKLEKVVRVIEETGMDWITEINTLRAMDYDPIVGKPRLSNTFGGQSGKSIHFCALAQVKKTRELTYLPIAGSGGVENSYDAKRFFGVGANVVQLGTGLEIYKNVEEFVKAVLKDL